VSDPIAAFVKYATAFEQGFAANDWGLVDVHFDDQIVWNVGGLPEPLSYHGRGRKEVSAGIKYSVDSFDRRFDKRDPKATKGPISIPGGIHLEWIVTYTRDGVPPFVLKGEEWDLFRDGRLVMHYELIHNGTEVLEYLRKHDAALLPSP